jgi:hypothetical protein
MRQQRSTRRLASRPPTVLDRARGAYIELLGSLGSNTEVKAEVTRFREQVDQMQLQMLGRKANRPQNALKARRAATVMKQVDF